MSDDFRAVARDHLNHLISCPESELDARAADCIADGSTWDISSPVGQLIGSDAVLEGLIRPIRRALTSARRRDEIFIGGGNRREAGGHWVAAVTHYVGNFENTLFGISPSDHLAFLAFRRILSHRRRQDHGSETDRRLHRPDAPGRALSPLPQLLGTEMLFPGPATHDGVLPDGKERGEATLDVVEGMLRDLHDFDPVTFTSRDQTGANGYWHEDMLWYGPAGIGSNYRWDGFVKDHP